MACPRLLLWTSVLVALATALALPAQEPTLTDVERSAIEAALPASAPATPKKPRRLLIFDRNVGYPGHRSIAHANLAFRRMGEKTGAFETVVSGDPQVFAGESLSEFDAVFLNNTVGNLFEDEELRRSLVEFVVAGGGLLGVHGTSVAFTRWPGAHEDWPEFGAMLGGRGARHRASDERVTIRIEAPGHPLLEPFPSEGFAYSSEFFRFSDPYSRKRVRVLLAIDTARTKLAPLAGGSFERDDGDYALAWVRAYGRGRVFYSTIGHAPGDFSDPRMLAFYLRAAQFALGDLPAPTTPSARLTHATRAQETLGWRLGVTAYSFHKYTLFEAIDKTSELGIGFIGGLSFQKVGEEIPKLFGPGLTDEELAGVRWKLDDAGVRMLTSYVHDLSGDEAHCRKVFAFARKLGIETLIGEPPLEALDTLERFSIAFDIQLAIHNHDREGSPHYWNPDAILRICAGRDRRIGACPDIGYWLRSDIDPIEGVRRLGDRLLTLQLHDLHAEGPEGHDVPWGRGTGETRRLLAEIRRLGITPTMFGLEYSYDWFDSMPEMRESAAFFGEVSVELAR